MTGIYISIPPDARGLFAISVVGLILVALFFCYLAVDAVMRALKRDDEDDRKAEIARLNALYAAAPYERDKTNGGAP